MWRRVNSCYCYIIPQLKNKLLPKNETLLSPINITVIIYIYNSRLPERPEAVRAKEIRSFLLCCFHLNASRCRRVERTPGCGRRRAQENLQETITTALYKEEASKAVGTRRPGFMSGSISISVPAFEPHTHRAELNMGVYSAFELMDADGRRLRDACPLSDMAFRIWSHSVHSSRLLPLIIHAAIKQKRAQKSYSWGLGALRAAKHSTVKTAFSQTFAL